MASVTMPLVGAIVVALLTFAAMIRTSGTLYRSMQLHSAPDDADVLSINNICRMAPLLATMLQHPTEQLSGLHHPASPSSIVVGAL